MSDIRYDTTDQLIKSKQFIKAKITKLRRNSTADILLADTNGEYTIEKEKVPIKYHCKPNPEILPSGGYKDAYYAFSVGEIVLVKIEDEDNYSIVANLTKKRLCLPKIIIYYDQYIIECQYDIYKNKFINFNFIDCDAIYSKNIYDSFFSVSYNGLPKSIVLNNTCFFSDIDCLYHDESVIDDDIVIYICDKNNAITGDYTRMISYSFSFKLSNQKYIHSIMHPYLFAIYNPFENEYLYDYAKIGNIGVSANVFENVIPNQCNDIVTDSVCSFLAQEEEYFYNNGYYNGFLGFQWFGGFPKYKNKSFGESFTYFIYNKNANILSHFFGYIGGAYIIEDVGVFPIGANTFILAMYRIDDDDRRKEFNNFEHRNNFNYCSIQYNNDRLYINYGIMWVGFTSCSYFFNYRELEYEYDNVNDIYINVSDNYYQDSFCEYMDIHYNIFNVDTKYDKNLKILYNNIDSLESTYYYLQNGYKLFVDNKKYYVAVNYGNSVENIIVAEYESFDNEVNGDVNLYLMKVKHAHLVSLYNDFYKINGYLRKYNTTNYDAKLVLYNFYNSQYYDITDMFLDSLKSFLNVNDIDFNLKYISHILCIDF